MISTFLAVLMLSMSKSYVFVTMFRAFALVVTIAGAHGMWLLPVLLTLFAGDKGVAESEKGDEEGGSTVSNPTVPERPEEDADDDAAD
jgi:hypothetical protein